VDITLWLAAGAIVGWLTYEYAGFNEDRGRLASILIGAMGGFLGGKVFAPMVGAASAVAGDLSMASLAVAALVAAAFLAAGNFIQNRWGF
jgi:uncharacterized membrane protein YeaQ/YmgE (transglycosylase-associated protein family)